MSEEESRTRTWTFQKTHTIMDGLVVRFHMHPKPWANQPEINVSRNGVSFDGAWPVMEKGRIDEVVAILKIATELTNSLEWGRSGEFLSTIKLLQPNLVLMEEVEKP